MKAQTLEGLMNAAAIDPREVVFAAPWEARAFAVALALCESGQYQWEEFRRMLIAEISRDTARSLSPQAYFRQFLRALEALLAAKGLVTAGELRAAAPNSSRQPGSIRASRQRPLRSKWPDSRRAIPPVLLSHPLAPPHGTIATSRVPPRVSFRAQRGISCH